MNAFRFFRIMQLVYCDSSLADIGICIQHIFILLLDVCTQLAQKVVHLEDINM